MNPNPPSTPSPGEQLAQLVQWVDPTLFLHPDDIADFADNAEGYSAPDDLDLCIAWGLDQIYQNFPDSILYFTIVDEINRGATPEEVNRFMVHQLTECYPAIQLRQVHEMLWGIRPRFLGVRLDDPDFVQDHPQAAEIVKDLLDPLPIDAKLPVRTASTFFRGYDLSDLDSLTHVAEALIDSLILQDAQPWANIAVLLMWFFGLSGNTLFDWDEDSFWQHNDWIEWTPDHLDSIQRIYNHALMLTGAVERAIQTLIHNDQVRHAFQHNIRLAKQVLEDIPSNTRFSERRPPRVRLEWPQCGAALGQLPLPGVWTEPAPDPIVLLFRDRTPESR